MPMEREDYGFAYNDAAASNHFGERCCERINAWYVCDNCGWEAIWRKGVPGLEIVHDPWAIERDREVV